MILGIDAPDASIHLRGVAGDNFLDLGSHFGYVSGNCDLYFFVFFQHMPALGLPFVEN